MSQNESDLIGVTRPGDPARTMLPKRLVAVIIALAFLPITLNGLGFSFSALPKPPAQNEDADNPAEEHVSRAQAVFKGETVYVILEWTAFTIALGTAVLAVTHYFLAQDVTTPTISTALFFSGMIDAFTALAVVHLLPLESLASLMHYPFIENIDRFLPFTWFISRLVNVCFLTAGTLPFVWHNTQLAARPRDKNLRYLILAAVLLFLMAYVIVFLCATSTSLPKSLLPDARVVHRPWDMIPLFLYLFAGSVVFPRFDRAQPSFFSHSLFVSVVPNVAAQLHAAFGSAALYDNNFNIASFEKIIAYLVPFMGLLLDYRRAYHADVALQVTGEKLRVARNVQQGLLPQSAPTVAGFDIEGCYLPADMVGGDYYDYVPMADGRWGIVVADVSGHEIGASLLMAKTRAYLRALVQSTDCLETLLGRLHQFLVVDTHDKWFVTMFFAAIDPETATMEYAGAAQQAHILRCDGSVEVLKSTSTPLGVFADHPPRCAPAVALRQGDTFIAVTDGIIEAKSPSGEQYGQNRMLDIVREYRTRPAAEIIAALNRSVHTFCAEAPAADDVTIVVVRRTLEPTESSG